MPGIVVIRAGLRRDLVSNSPCIARRRFDLDHVSAEVGQDHGCAGARDEARQIHYFQSRKDIVSCHYWLLCETPYRLVRLFMLTHITAPGIAAGAFEEMPAFLP